MRMADIDTIFQELRLRENTPKGLEALDREQSTIQTTIQRLELLLWFKVEQGVRPFRLHATWDCYYRHLLAKYQRNAQKRQENQQREMLPHVEKMVTKCMHFLFTFKFQTPLTDPR